MSDSLFRSNGNDIRRSKKNRAFTIVELLAVIAIISILVGLLLPALKSAQSAALTIQCLSQLNQIGAAFHSYADDFDGYLPPSRIKLQHSLTVLGGKLGYFPLKKFDRKSLIVCPEDIGPRLEAGFYYSYGRNNNATGLATVARSLLSLRRPSQTLLLLDSWNASIGLSMQHVAAFSTFVSYADIGRHAGKIGCVFIDGHVEALYWPLPNTKENPALWDKQQ